MATSISLGAVMQRFAYLLELVISSSFLFGGVSYKAQNPVPHVECISSHDLNRFITFQILEVPSLLENGSVVVKQKILDKTRARKEANDGGCCR